MTWLLIALGAAVGAPLRYLTDRVIRELHDSPFPYGTVAVNLAGSLVLGFVAEAAAVHAVSGSVLALVGTGFCGALTTYSTFGFETIRLAEERLTRLAVLNAVISVLLGLGAASLGWWLASVMAAG